MASWIAWDQEVRGNGTVIEGKDNRKIHTERISKNCCRGPVLGGIYFWGLFRDE